MRRVRVGICEKAVEWIFLVFGSSYFHPRGWTKNSSSTGVGASGFFFALVASLFYWYLLEMSVRALLAGGGPRSMGEALAIIGLNGWLLRAW